VAFGALEEIRDIPGLGIDSFVKEIHGFVKVLFSKSIQRLSERRFPSHLRAQTQ
jgi:hypothetical protein